MDKVNLTADFLVKSLSTVKFIYLLQYASSLR